MAVTSTANGVTGSSVGPDAAPGTQPRRAWDQQLAIPRTSMRLRTECLKDVLTDDGQHTVVDPRTETWSDVQDAFEDYLWKKRDYATAEWCDLNHRFTKHWCQQKYGALCGVDRWCQRNFNDLYTVWMTLTGNKRNSANGWRCPLDYLTELLSSNGKVRQRINTHLDNRYARFTVIGGHKHAYPHVHWGFYIEGHPEREPFLRALNAHIENSPVAAEYQHPPDDAVSIEPADPDPQYDTSDNIVSVTRLVHEASSQLLWPSDEGRDVLDCSPHERRFGTLLWASQYTQQWRTGSDFDDACEAAQTAWAEAQSDTDDSEDTNDDDDAVDYDAFEDAANPTVEIEPNAWSNKVDPIDRE